MRDESTALQSRARRPPAQRGVPPQEGAAPATGGAIGARRRQATLGWGLTLADLLAATPGLILLTELGSGRVGRPLLLGLAVLVLWSAVFRAHGLYGTDRLLRHSTLDEIPRLAAACTSACVVASASVVVLDARSPATEQLLLAIVSSFALSFALRGLVRGGWKHFAPRERGLLVGSGDLALAAARRLRLNPEHRLELAGYLASRRTHAARSLEGEYEIPCLGEASEVLTAALLSDIDRVIIADELLEASQIIDVLTACKVSGLRATIVPRDAGVLGSAAALNRLSDLPLLEIGNTGISPWTLRVKRLVDLLVGSLLLVLLSPVLAAIALAVRLDSPGPALFRQNRIGRAGVSFRMFKFRTMTSDAEERLGDLIDLEALPEPAFKLMDDPRVTSVGRWLRRTSLDELPQLVNVVGGSMSLVGPRPEESAVVARYAQSQRVRLAVKPGLTGPMQVYGRADLTFDERLALEREYIESLSLALDLSLLARTPRAVLRGAGAY